MANTQQGIIGERMARDYLKMVVHPHGVLLQADWIFRRRENDVFNYYLVEVKRQDVFLADDGKNEAMPFDGHGLPPRQVKARLTLYEDTGIRPILLVFEVSRDRAFWQYMDVLDGGDQFVTGGKSKRVIYPICQFYDVSHEVTAVGIFDEYEGE